MSSLTWGRSDSSAHSFAGFSECTPKPYLVPLTNICFHMHTRTHTQKLSSVKEQYQVNNSSLYVALSVSLPGWCTILIGLLLQPTSALIPFHITAPLSLSTTHINEWCVCRALVTLMEAGSSAQLQLLLKRAVNERQQKRVAQEGGRSCTYVCSKHKSNTVRQSCWLSSEVTKLGLEKGQNKPKSSNVLVMGKSRSNALWRNINPDFIIQNWNCIAILFKSTHYTFTEFLFFPIQKCFCPLMHCYHSILQWHSYGLHSVGPLFAIHCMSRLCKSYLSEKRVMECCIWWPDLHNHLIWTQFRWSGMNWSGQWRKGNQQVLNTSGWRFFENHSRCHEADWEKTKTVQSCHQSDGRLLWRI